MATLHDMIQTLTASTNAALARVDEDVQALQAQIAALQAQIDAGVATPEDMEALAAIQAKLDALDPTKPNTLPSSGPF